MNDKLEKALEFLKEAIEADGQQDYAKAFGLYTKGIEYLMIFLKYEKNEKKKEVLRKKINEYLERAELIKDSFDVPKLEIKSMSSGQ